RAGLAVELERAAAAIAGGAHLDPAPLYRAAAWLEQLASAAERIDGRGSGATLDALEAELHRRVRDADPRRQGLRALSNVTSGRPVEGLELLVARATAALEALDRDALPKDAFAPLQAAHELLAARGVVAHDRMNVCIPLVVQAGLPVTLVLADAGAL